MASFNANSLKGSVPQFFARLIRTAHTTQLTKRSAFSVFGALVMALWSAAPVHAQSNSALAIAKTPHTQTGAGGTVKALLTQYKVVKANDGTEKLEDASQIKPGDIIEYRVTYTNSGNEPVSGLLAKLPIPLGLQYQPKSAKPSGDLVQFSVGKGAFSPEPLMRTTVGKSERVPYAEYREIQWSLGRLPAHGEAAVTARVQVESLMPQVPAESAVPSPPPLSTRR
ncbi:hypothetical protein [Xylophilus sp. GOD-11R]|uniref:hypothetical protein n=1 Tax=Xylophilus sp. GOD-11R TaxID=3089814 RepID=UPI00298BE1F8|nr:hypothetical protein [Xylophilus sp. GOD-11R]WPB58028.1 hypothetical protein R9X41_05140 [Xylophilus sp. GOD-11R]